MSSLTTMNVISLHQPYASLVMAGVKQWETRPMSPNGDMRPEGVRGLPGKRINHGERIAIHASKRKPKNVYAHDQGSISATVMDWETMELHDGWVQLDECEFGGGNFEWLGDLGVILGTVEVVNVVPIRDCSWSTPHICRVGDVSLLAHSAHDAPWPDNQTEHDITDQLPYGDWTPGRWGWQLANPHRFGDDCSCSDGRVPWSPGVPLDGYDRCPVCLGVTEPIPVKGKQGVWEWAA